MEEGAVIKVAFIQGDGKIKFRPAVIIASFPPYNDRLVCGISSKTDRKVKGLDIVIDRTHPDFKTWGLDYPGVIRTGFLLTVPENMINGTIGKISRKTRGSILKNLFDHLLD